MKMNNRTPKGNCGTCFSQLTTNEHNAFTGGCRSRLIASRHRIASGSARLPRATSEMRAVQAHHRGCSDVRPFACSLTNWPTLGDGDGISLHSNLNRWYDASVGEWISEDPMGFDAGDANLSRYVRNAATTTIDSLGLIEWSDDPERDAAQKELKGSDSGKALIAEIEALEKKTGVPVKVLSAAQARRDLVKESVWEKMSREQRKADVEKNAIRWVCNEVGSNEKKPHFITVTINPRQSKPGDPKQSWYAIGDQDQVDSRKRDQVRLWDRLSEKLFHELLHARQELEGKGDASRKPTKEQLEGLTEKEWGTRWGHVVEYEAIHEMKETYYKEFHIPAPTRHRTTPEQDECAERLKAELQKKTR
jgi:RHS repeat-associated protein